MERYRFSKDAQYKAGAAYSVKKLNILDQRIYVQGMENNFVARP